MAGLFNVTLFSTGRRSETHSYYRAHNESWRRLITPSYVEYNISIQQAQIAFGFVSITTSDSIRRTTL
jgi:hypothetical protein